MKIAGIIAEYNPFHNGHQFQIEKTRQNGATHVVAVMSGSFVQRGDIAVCSKWARAKACLLNGIDLVVEMPTIFALSSANTFAYGGVYILNQLNVDMLSFGSEEGNIETLKKLVELIDEAEATATMSDYLNQGMSYPKAREMAVNELYGAEYGNIMRKANNSLGIEYVRAIKKINPAINPMTIKREQVDHDSSSLGETIASASYMRELIQKESYEEFSHYMPQSAYDIFKLEIENKLAPVEQSNIEQAMLYKLKTMSIDDFAIIPDVSEGLENRLYKAAISATSITEFFEMVKTKRYTLARIRRIAYCALLGITKQHQSLPPQYIRVLAANKKGIEILSKAKNTSTIPIGTKFADLYSQNPMGIEIDVRATDVFSLAQPKIQPSNLDFTTNTVIIK